MAAPIGRRGDARPNSAPSLRAMADNTLRDHWSGKRSHNRNKSQVGTAVKFLEGLGCQSVADVLPAHLVQLRNWTLGAGASVSTLNIRLSCLSALGVSVKFHPLPRHRKWFLSQAEEDSFRALNLPPPLPAFVIWTIATGLRIEESLALRWRDVDLAAATVSVPGTKTDMAQALLPLSAEAHEVLAEHHAQADAPLPGDRVFALRYEAMRKRWQEARKALGVDGIPTSTLKSLRRSFARRAHLKGMPIDVLRQYLRHENIKTTQGYLWLVGGYSQDEMRRWL